MRIMVIGEAVVLSKISEHLREYGEVEEVETSKFHGVTQGTSWVCILDGGKMAGRILSAAGRADARAVSLPTAWAHAEEKLRLAGFFEEVKRARGAPAGATAEVKPFAQVADALTAKRAREREEAERKAREAMERGMNPPPPPKLCDCGNVATLDDLCDDCVAVLTAPPAEESTGMAPPEGAKPPTAVEARPALLNGDKLRRLESIFEMNPDLSIADASKMLAALSPDRRSVAYAVLSETRRRVRARHGLATEVRRYSRIHRLASGSPLADAYVTDREDRGVNPPPSPTSPTSPTSPSGRGGRLPLPKSVEDAARLLGEELERAPEVAEFTLTYRRGERPRVRWRPDVEEDLAL